MRIPVTVAKNRLNDLIKRAEAGEEVILTRYNNAAIRLVPIRLTPQVRDRRKLLEALGEAGAARATLGPSAARSQDFLYGDDGLPE